MNQLAKIQNAFYDFLKGKPSNIEAYVVGKNQQEVKRRLNIYREAYELRLEDNLKKQFPMLYSYLGTEAFIEMAKQYNQVFPPKDYAIRQYGANLANFLKQNTSYVNYLSELAAFEWAMNVALDESADAHLLTMNDLQQLTPAQLMANYFYFHPSLQLMNFQYDIPAWWQMLKKGKAAKSTTPTEKAVFCLVWRKALLPYFRTIDTKETAAFQAAQSSKNFNEICEAILPYSNEDEAASHVVAIIMQWLTDGLLINSNQK